MEYTIERNGLSTVYLLKLYLCCMIQWVYVPQLMTSDETSVASSPRETRYRDIGGCEISEVNKCCHPATVYVLILF